MQLKPILYIPGHVASHAMLFAGPRSLQFKREVDYVYIHQGQPRKGAYVRRYESMKALEAEQDLILNHRSTPWPVYFHADLVADTDEEKAVLAKLTLLEATIVAQKAEVERLTMREGFLTELLEEYEREEGERKLAEGQAAEARRLQEEAQMGPGPGMDASEGSNEPAAKTEGTWPDGSPVEDDEPETVNPPAPANQPPAPALSDREARREAARQAAAAKAAGTSNP